MKCFSISGYDIVSWNEVKLSDLRIALGHNESGDPVQVFIGNLTIKINNWFFFIISCVFFYLLSINSFLCLINLLRGKFIEIYINNLTCYIKTERLINYKEEDKNFHILKLADIFSDICVSNAFVVYKVQLCETSFLFGFKVGCLTVKNQKNIYKFLIRRSTIRYREFNFTETNDYIKIKDSNFKKIFIALFNKNLSCRLLNIPGQIIINAKFNIKETSIFVEEECFDREFCGVYLQFSEILGLLYYLNSTGNIGGQNMKKKINSCELHISCILRKLKIEDFYNGLDLTFFDMSGDSNFKSSSLERFSIEANNLSILFHKFGVAVVKTHRLKACYDIYNMLDIEVGLFRIELFNNITSDIFLEHSRVIEIPLTNLSIVFDFSKEEIIQCIININIYGSLILLNSSGTLCNINNSDSHFEKELYLLDSNYNLTFTDTEFFEIKGCVLSEINGNKKFEIQSEIKFLSEIEVIDESSTIKLNFGNERVYFVYSQTGIKVKSNDICILYKQITNLGESDYFTQNIASFVFKSFKQFNDKIELSKQINIVEMCNCYTEITDCIYIECSKIKFISSSEMNSNLSFDSLNFKYKLPIGWYYSEMFLSTRVGELNIELFENSLDWEKILINKFIICEESYDNLSVCHELVNFRSTMTIYNYSSIKANSKIYIELPEIKFDISKDNTNIFDLLLSLKKKIPSKKYSLFFKREGIVEFVFESVTLNIFDLISNKYNIFTIYVEKVTGSITSNQKGNNIKYDINKLRLFIGEKEMDNTKLVKFPFSNEINYLLIEKAECHDVICYEFIERENSTNYFTRANICNFFEDSFYPILLCDIKVYLNVNFKIVDGSLIISYFGVSFGKISTNSVFILLDFNDIFKIVKFLKFDNKTHSIGLLNLLRIDNISLKLSSITLLLFNQYLRSKDKISIFIEDINITKDNDICNFELNKFQVCIINPSKNFIEQQIGIYIGDSLEINKFDVNILEATQILNINSFNLGFNYNGKVTKARVNIEEAKLMLIKELLTKINDSIANIHNSFYSSNNFVVIRHFNCEPLKVLSSIRQCPNYNNNIIKSLKNQILSMDYLEIYCFFGNLNLSYKNIDIKLNSGSKYLVELSESPFNINFVSSCLYLPKYFIKNNCYFDNLIRVYSSKEIPIKFQKDLISFGSTKHKCYTGALLLGIKIRISSEIKQNLRLYFSSKHDSVLNLSSEYIISEKKYIDCSLDFLFENNYIYIFHKNSQKCSKIYESGFRNYLNFLNIFNSLTSGSETFYCDYTINYSNYCIGIECYKDQNTIFMRLFNTTCLVNISGTELYYRICNSTSNCNSKKNRNLRLIENFSIQFTPGVNYKEELCLNIEYPGNSGERLKVDLNRENSVKSEYIDSMYVKFSYSKGNRNFANIQLNIYTFIENHRFYIVIWPSVVVFNLTNYDFILTSLTNETELYYINKRKQTYRRRILPSTTILGYDMCRIENRVVTLFTANGSIKYEFDIRNKYENESRNLLVDYNNNISINIRDYINYIKNETILGIIQRLSIEIKSISIEPYWSITNYSSFTLNILSNNNVFITTPNAGYFDCTNSNEVNLTINNYQQNNLKIKFDNFSTIYTLNMYEKYQFNDVINLYRSNSPNELWEMVEIEVTINNSLCDFYPEFNIIISDFKCEKGGNYYVLKNKTKISYILSQANINSNLEEDLLFSKIENLSTGVLRSRFLEKVALKLECETEERGVNNNSAVNSIYLFPDYYRNNKPLYWGNDINKSKNKLILVEYLDKGNNRVELDYISLTNCERSVTKRFNYCVCDSNDSVKTVQLSVNAIKLNNEIIQICFYDLSLLSVKMAPNPAFLPSKNFTSYFPNKEKRLEFEITASIQYFQLVLGNIITEEAVVLKKNTFQLSPIGTPKNLSLFVSHPVGRELQNFIPTVNVILNNFRVEIRKNKNLELGNTQISYTLEFNAKNIDFSVFRENKTIVEILNGKNSSPTSIKLSIFEDEATDSKKLHSSVRYQTWDINVDLPSLNVNLKLNDYLRILLSNFVNQRKIQVWNSDERAKRSGIVIFFNKCNLSVQRVTVNNILFLLNYRDSIKSHLKLCLENSDTLFNLLGYKIKTIFKNVIKSILLKRINSVVNFNSLVL